jgi:adenylate cyclase
MERRLAAIFAADVVGYSRLMGVSEARTLAALKAHRRELVDGKIAEHQGRIVKLTGDGMLVEFPSVVNAVACAVEIQRRMQERNADVQQDQRIEFRIGVNLGDIIVEDNDIFGDGVNVAARIEGIAKPGGVCVSASVRDNVGNRLELAFEDMGEQALKNIERPVRVYNVSLDAPPPRAAAPQPQPGPPVKEKPSIAVLPFNNMSGDPEQEYFSDGITEDIITDLSKISGLSVIARNSVFTYKGKPADVQEVSRRFNVATVLEGSVRKAGQRVRITAQLVGKDGMHVWADRFDRDLTDIFAIQDEITKTSVEQLKVKLLPAEKEVIAQAPRPRTWRPTPITFAGANSSTDTRNPTTCWPSGCSARRSSSIRSTPALMPESPTAIPSSSCITTRISPWRTSWRPPPRPWIWRMTLPKRMLREPSGCRLRSATRRRRQSSNGRSR